MFLMHKSSYVTVLVYNPTGISLQHHQRRRGPPPGHSGRPVPAVRSCASHATTASIHRSPRLFEGGPGGGWGPLAGQSNKRTGQGPLKDVHALHRVIPFVLT